VFVLKTAVLQGITDLQYLNVTKPPGMQVLWSFSGDAIKFIRHQTVLSGLTYLSRHAVTYLSVRMRSVT